MTVRQRHNLLRGLDDTREVVVMRGADGDVLKQVWRAAQDEADDAYDAWHEHSGSDAYLLYRAATDRADAALDALVAATARRH
ncbi:MAG TPA: hypothetical protein VNT03_19770 [Baekduia sp.]|nr:hypothetical protein [Baekduia sp.]